MLEGKMERFCEEYVLDFNPQRAAIRAGYAQKSAKTHSYTLLKRRDVMERICELQGELVRSSLLDSRDRLLREYWKIYERAVQAQPVTVWDKELKEYVPTGEYQFDDKIAVKCLEAIAKLGGAAPTEPETEEESFELVVRVVKDEDTDA